MWNKLVNTLIDSHRMGSKLTRTYVEMENIYQHVWTTSYLFNIQWLQIAFQSNGFTKAMVWMLSWDQAVKWSRFVELLSKTYTNNFCCTRLIVCSFMKKTLLHGHFDKSFGYVLSVNASNIISFTLLLLVKVADFLWFSQTLTVEILLNAFLLKRLFMIL